MAKTGMLVDTLLDDMDLEKRSMDDMTDEELAVLAKSDKTASEKLIRRYCRLILVKAEIFANPVTDSDDLSQEAMISLMRAINSFDPARGVKFSTYAETCIVNRMKTICTGKKTAPKISGSLDDMDDCEVLSAEETPESIFLYKELISELRESVESVLSPAESRTLQLCMQGMSYRSAAEKLGVSEKAVDNAMQRARRKLRHLYFNKF
jgi:RNA polymerase sporulation-specific sigma factor